MRDGTPHEAVQRDGRIREIGEELGTLGIVVSDSNGDAKRSFPAGTPHELKFMM